MDSCTTQNGESQHRRVKRLFGRTNKKNFARDIAKLEARGRKLRDIHRRISKNPSMSFQEMERLPKTRPDIHYHMASSRKKYEHLPSWLGENYEDPALKNFMDDLRQHVINRLLERNGDTPLTPDEVNGLDVKDDKAYWHKTLRVNHTTYDVQHSLESINPRTHPDVMVLSADDESVHPFEYARIVGLFHLDVSYTGPGSRSRAHKRIDIAWVRWFQYDSNYSSGFSARRLPRLYFFEHSEPAAFGFLDPDLIIRGAHLIPAFAHGKTDEYLPPSIVRSPDEDDEDFCFYYVNIFVDRDTFMRHHGGGIGHKITWHLNEILLKDSTGFEIDQEEMEDGIEEDWTGNHDENDRETEDEELEGQTSESESGFETDDVDEGDENKDESEGYADL